MIQDKRCIHLDFHTSERIPDIGAAFEADAFADAFGTACDDYNLVLKHSCTSF